MTCPHAARASLPSTQLRWDLVAAISVDVSISEILRVHQVGRTTYYRWLSIGRGEFVRWWDGCAVDPWMALVCHELAVDIAVARVDREQSRLDRLMSVNPKGAP